jgi:hypothetical protein
LVVQVVAAFEYRPWWIVLGGNERRTVSSIVMVIWWANRRRATVSDRQLSGAWSIFFILWIDCNSNFTNRAALNYSRPKIAKTGKIYFFNLCKEKREKSRIVQEWTTETKKNPKKAISDLFHPLSTPGYHRCIPFRHKLPGQVRGAVNRHCLLSFHWFEIWDYNQTFSEHHCKQSEWNIHLGALLNKMEPMAKYTMSLWDPVYHR